MSQSKEPHHAPAWLDVDLGDAAANLALDEALLEAAHEGTLAAPVVRMWTAPEATVILGSSSRVEEEVDVDACAAAHARLVRRTSGGLTVLLGPGCHVWSVVAPHPDGAPPIDAIHATTLEPLAAALRAAGRHVERRGTSDLALVDGGACRKVSGNALRVRRGAVLYHGTLLDSFDLAAVARLLRHPPREPGYRAGRPHGDFLANLGLGAAALAGIVRRAFGADAAAGDWPREHAARLAAERFASVEWTRRL
ncbi:MAG: biotin/lipoate A/B protein ligase family protein [Planctomycetaceae bacterium]